MFQPIVVQNFEQNKEIINRSKLDVQIQIAERNLENAFFHNIRISDKEAIKLQSLFPRRIVCQNPAPKQIYHDSSHPILRVLNDYSNHLAKNVINQNRKIGLKTLSIGDSFNNKVNADHNCNLLLSVRDNVRALSSAMSACNHSLFNHITNGHPTPICTNGAQKCLFQADIAVAIHSTYDMTMADLIKIFDKHSITKMYVYMYIPLYLYDPDLQQIENHEDIYHLRSRKEGCKEYIHMDMHDFSNNYHHSLSNWKKWANFTRLVCEKFQICRETVETIGPLHVLSLMKTPLIHENIWMEIPITSFGLFYELPCVFEFVKNRFKLSNHHKKYIIPTHVIQESLAYANRVADSAYKFAEFATHLSSTLRAITIGTVVYQPGWSVDTETYQCVAFSLFIFGAIRRTKRTVGISAVFEEMKNSANQFKFINTMLNSIKKSIHKITGFFSIFNYENFDLWDVEIKTLQSYAVSNTYYRFLDLNNFNCVRQKHYLSNYNHEYFVKEDIKDCIEEYELELEEEVLTSSLIEITKEILDKNNEINKQHQVIQQIHKDFKSKKIESNQNSTPIPGEQNRIKQTKRKFKNLNEQSIIAATRKTMRENAGYEVCIEILFLTPEKDNETLYETATNTDESNNESLEQHEIKENIHDNINDSNKLNEFKELQKQAEINLSNDSISIELCNENEILKPIPPLELTEKENDVILHINELAKPLNENESTSHKRLMLTSKNLYSYQCILNCVSTNFNNYNNVSEQLAYYYDLTSLTILNKSVEVGDVIPYEGDDGRIIINIIIKSKNFDIPTESDVIKCLENLNVYLQQNDINVLHLPPILSGYDKFTWATVEKLITKYVTYPLIIFVHKNKFEEFSYYSENSEILNNRLFKLKFDDTPISNYANICVSMFNNFDGEDHLTRSLLNEYPEIRFIENTTIGTAQLLVTESLHRIIILFVSDSNNIDDRLESFKNCFHSLKQMCVKDNINEIHIHQNNIIRLFNIHNFMSTIELNFIGIDFTFKLHRKDMKFRKLMLSIELFDFKVIESRDFPNNEILNQFRTGQCALQSFYEAMKIKQPINRYLNHVMINLIEALPESTLNIKIIQDYIFKGIWFTSHISDFTLTILSYIYKVDISITTIEQKYLIGYIPRYDKTVDIYYTGTGKCGHYSSRPSAGAIDKFPKLIDNVLKDINGIKNIIELSCAPGYLINMLQEKHKLNCIGLIYKNENIKLTQLNKSIKYFEYNDDLKKFDLFTKQYQPINTLIICDAASSTSSENIIDTIIPKIPFIESHNFLIKIFSYTELLYNLMDHFEKHFVYETIKDSEERYILMVNYNLKPFGKLINIKKDFCKCYYDFKIPKSILVDKFIENFYNDEFKHFKCFYKNNKPTNDFVVRIFSGFASSGKTTKAVAYYKDRKIQYGENFIMVAPTCELRDYHIQKYDVKSCTPHMFFKTYSNENHVLIDEISQFPIEFFHMINNCFNCNIVLLGDVQQTPYVNYIDHTKYTTCKNVGIHNNMSLVHSIPQDIIKIINQCFKFNLTSTSKVEKSIFHYDSPSLEALRDYVHIAFNNDTVLNLKNDGYNAMTITAATGQRIARVAFHIDAHALNSDLANRTEWVYVALSRHTDTLVTVNNPLDRILNIHGTKIELFSQHNQIKFHNESRYLPEKFKLSTVPCIIPTFKIDFATITSILDRIVKPYNSMYNSFAYLESNQIDAVKSGSIKMDLQFAASENLNIKGFRLPSGQKYVREQFNISKRATISTMITRYLSKTPSINGKKLEIQIEQLKIGFMRTIYGKIVPEQKLKEDLFLGDNDLLFCATDYLQALGKKIGENQTKLKEILDMDFDFLQDLKIDFFMKKQAKFDSKEGFDTSKKVGQGVASVMKSLNVLLSAYGRALMKRIPEISKNNKHPFYLFTHGSDKDISDQYKQGIQGHKYEDYLWICNDFSEWDAHYNNTFTELTCYILECCGLDRRIINWYRINRKQWRMVCFTKEGKIVIKGSDKQFSGGPLTIFENSILNATLMNTIFKFTDLILAGYKGDDSANFAKSATLTPIGKRFIEDNNLLLKKHASKFGEFAGFFMTPYGFFPDVVRQTAKFISKTYKDNKHFNEALQSVQEKITVVDDIDQYCYGSVVAAQHYHCTQQDIKCLFTFLQQSRSVKFSSLEEVCLGTLKIPDATKY